MPTSLGWIFFRDKSFSVFSHADGFHRMNWNGFLGIFCISIGFPCIWWRTCITRRPKNKEFESLKIIQTFDFLLWFINQRYQFLHLFNVVRWRFWQSFVYLLDSSNQWRFSFSANSVWEMYRYNFEFGIDWEKLVFVCNENLVKFKCVKF